MSAELHGLSIVGATTNVDIDNGAVTSTGALSLTTAVGSNMTLSGDGYVSISSAQGAVAIVSDGGDVTLAANSPAGADVILQTNSTGEVSVRSTLKQYGTNGTITISNGSIANTGTMTMTASGGLATVSGLTGVSLSGGVGDVTLSGANIYMSGEVDTASGDLTIKAGNGSDDVNVTALIVAGRAGQPGLTVTGGSSSSDGITVTGGSTNGNGIVSTASGSGTGVYAISSTGYGLWAQTDTVEPAFTALRIEPQDKDASSGFTTEGDVYINSNSGLMSAARSDGYWGRMVTKLIAPHFAITEDMDSDTSESTTIYALPANSVRQGSTIRIFISGNFTSAVGLPTFAIYIDGVAGTFSQQITNNTNRFRVESTMTVREVGSSGIIQASTNFITLINTTYSNRFFEDTYSSLNFTNGANIQFVVLAAEGGANYTISQMVVDITD